MTTSLHNAPLLNPRSADDIIQYVRSQFEAGAYVVSIATQDILCLLPALRQSNQEIEDAVADLCSRIDAGIVRPTGHDYHAPASRWLFFSPAADRFVLPGNTVTQDAVPPVVRDWFLGSPDTFIVGPKTKWRKVSESVFFPEESARRRFDLDYHAPEFSVLENVEDAHTGNRSQIRHPVAATRLPHDVDGKRYFVAQEPYRLSILFAEVDVAPKA